MAELLNSFKSMFFSSDDTLSTNKSKSKLLTFDQCYLDNITTADREVTVERPRELVQLAHSLDISRISDRLIAMGSVWKQRTEKLSNRNNYLDVASFLNTRYPHQRYTVWNLSSSEYPSDISEVFNHQVISYPTSRNSHLSVKAIFDLCRTIDAVSCIC